MMRRNWQRELRKNSNEVRGKLREWWSPFNWNVFTISYAQTVPIGFRFYISLLNYFATAGLNTYEVHTRLPNHLGFSWILLMRGIERRTESDLKKKKRKSYFIVILGATEAAVAVSAEKLCTMAQGNGLQLCQWKFPAVRYNRLLHFRSSTKVCFHVTSLVAVFPEVPFYIFLSRVVTVS